MTDRTYTLREVYVYAMVIDEDTLHLEICLFAVFLIFKFYECILETLPGALVTYDLTREDFAKTAEDQVQIFICGWTHISLAARRGPVPTFCLPCVTGLSLQTKSTFSGGLTSAKGRSPTISKVRA